MEVAARSVSSRTVTDMAKAMAESAADSQSTASSALPRWVTAPSRSRLGKGMPVDRAPRKQAVSSNSASPSKACPTRSIIIGVHLFRIAADVQRRDYRNGLQPRRIGTGGGHLNAHRQGPAFGGPGGPPTGR